MLKFLDMVWYCIGRFASVGFAHLICRITLYNKDSVPRTGPVIILANHQSFLDPVFVQAGIRRRLTFVARDSLWKMPFFGPLIHSYGTIPIKRGHADLAAIKRIINAIREGKGVCLFPEATRTTDGRISPIKPGFGLITRRTNAPIIPVVIDGAFECWPRTRKLPRAGSKVSIVYGEPISAERAKELGDEGLAAELTSALRRLQAECRQKAGKPAIDYKEDTENHPGPEVARHESTVG